MRGLDTRPPVLFRRARDAIGIRVHKKFEEGVHDEEDAEDCPLLGKRAMNQMVWLVKRVRSCHGLGSSSWANCAQGDKITPLTKKIMKCYLVIKEEDFEEDTEKIIRYQDLYACTSNNPPTVLEKSSKYSY